MKQYASLLQRILSILVIVGLAVVLALVGIVFLWYFLVFGLVMIVVRKVYLFFKVGKTSKPGASDAPFEPGHVEAGDFSRGPGRIIDHTDDTPGINP